MGTFAEPRTLIELVNHLKINGYSEKKIQETINRFIEKKARRYLVPVSGHFELTPLCNLDCKMCYVHLNNSQFQTKKLLDTATWIDLIKQARRAGMIHACLTGGECLTYPGFDEVYLYLYNMGIAPSILTNGVLIDSKRLEFFKLFSPRIIQVSLYGYNEAVYEKVTGHRVFHTVIENIQRIRKENIPVRISITPSSYLNDVTPIIALAKDLDIPYGINPKLTSPRKNTGRVIKDAPIDQYVEIFRSDCELNDIKLTPNNPEHLPTESHGSFHKKGLTCGAGTSSFAITYNGELCPCPSLGELSVELLNRTFLDAWNAINKIVKEFPLPQECAECVYYEQCLHCVAMHKNATEKGHCDSRICERTKKMIIAGLYKIPAKSNEIS